MHAEKAPRQQVPGSAAANKDGGGHQGRSKAPARRLAQQAKATLRYVRFSSGTPYGPVQLSPRLSKRQRQDVEFWIRRLPESFRERLPRLKLAVAEELTVVQGGLFINDNPFRQSGRPREHMHAVSFIPEGYVVLEAGLFGRRVELGRILYHEFCHFVWPRLGNQRRRRFQDLIKWELRERVRGELGYSSESRKAHLLTSRSPASRGRTKLDYFCESFCDTGSFVLLGTERRECHSEYTLQRKARERRCREWYRLVMESAAPPALGAATTRNGTRRH